jgi:antitoxin component YwqK of YwqJK toxin-antitoxin module
MKKQIILLFIFCISIFSIAKSQSNKRYVYYLDATLASVEKSKAVVLGEGSYENGAFRINFYSMNRENLYLTAFCTDSTLAEFNGLYTSFHLNGHKEEEGNYKKGSKEGTWQKWDSLQRKVDSTVYLQDQPILSTTFSYYKNGVLSYYTTKDSLLDTYTSVSYNKEGVIDGEVFFQGQKGIIKTFTENGIVTDSVFTREEKEAEFPGGEKGWRSYLERNLNPDIPVNRMAPPRTYTVRVKFIVQTDGSITDITAETYHGYGMEEEVIRVLKNGPKWIPAVQYGRKVKAYRIQPVTFVVSLR